MADQYEVASRLLDLIDLVDSGGQLRLAEIEKRFDVNNACARDYVAWIGQRRQLVEEKEGKSKVWSRAPAPDGSPTALRRAGALAFAEEALGELAGTEHHEALVAMAREARLAVPVGARARLDQVVRNFQVRRTERPLNAGRVGILRELMRAIDGRHPCEMVYRKATGEVKRYAVEPWGLLLHRGRLLFSAGKSPEQGVRRERRFFNVDAVESLKCFGDEQFDEPAPQETKWDALFRDSLGIYCDWPTPAVDVYLRVAGHHAVHLTQRAVHPSQQTSPLPDGWLDVRLRVVVCPDLVSWILAMLPHVRVVGPAELTAEIRTIVGGWDGAP